jgi:quinol monooxygenase YgiN
MSKVTYFVRMVAKEGVAEEAQELLLTNVTRIQEGEQGNLAFTVHRSTDNPNEFWLYETWESEEAVKAHESGPAFQSTKRSCARWWKAIASSSATQPPIAVLGHDV